MLAILTFFFFLTPSVRICSSFSPFGFCDSRLLHLYLCDYSISISFSSFSIHSLSIDIFFRFPCSLISSFSCLYSSTTLMFLLVFLYVWPSSLSFELQIVFPTASLSCTHEEYLSNACLLCIVRSAVSTVWAKQMCNTTSDSSSRSIPSHISLVSKT